MLDSVRMHRLDHIHISGFKSIRDQSLKLGGLNVLIGANGAGKSNFIGVFRLLNEIINENLQLYVGRSGGADRFLYFGSKTTEQIVIDLSFDQNAYRCTLVPAAPDALVFGEEILSYQGRHGHEELTGGGHRESALARKTRPREPDLIVSKVIETLQDWKVYHFHDTSATARIKQTGDIADNVVLRPDAGNLAAFLYRLQETDSGAFRNIVETVQLAAPFLGGLDLRPDRLNQEKIRLEWHEKGTDTYFDAHDLSDGTLRFLCLATLLLQPEPPTTILIDEPELGLHPYAITLLADLLCNATERAQVVVSTQSVTLVNQLSPEDVVVVDREGSESVFRRPSSKDLKSWLDGYSLGDLWEKNVLGGRPRP